MGRGGRSEATSQRESAKSQMDRFSGGTPSLNPRLDEKHLHHRRRSRGRTVWASRAMNLTIDPIGCDVGQAVEHRFDGGGVDDSDLIENIETLSRERGCSATV